jgi:multidrug efflux pump subunit AcrA (membrane-fusion protein)
MSTTAYPGSVGPGSDEHKTDAIRARRRHRVILMSGGALLLIALVSGFVPQLRQRQTAAADTKELAIPTVAVISPTATTPHSGLNLPAEVKPWQEASIFARVNGYLKDWLVDIGAHVQKDQLLAEIDTPDLDHTKKVSSPNLMPRTPPPLRARTRPIPKRLPPIFVSSNRKSPSNV